MLVFLATRILLRYHTSGHEYQYASETHNFSHQYSSNNRLHITPPHTIHSSCKKNYNIICVRKLINQKMKPCRKLDKTFICYLIIQLRYRLIKGYRLIHIYKQFCSYKVAKTTCSLQKGDKVCFTRPLMQEFRAENLYDNKRHQKHGHSLSVKLYILRSAYICSTISNHFWNRSNVSPFKSLLIM